MRRRTALAALSLWAAWSGAALAQEAAPPIGTWNGPAGAMLAVSANGTYVYRIPAAQISGMWQWRPTAPNGGILVLLYRNPTLTQTFVNRLYLSILLVSADEIRVFGDPFRRQ